MKLGRVEMEAERGGRNARKTFLFLHFFTRVNQKGVGECEAGEELANF